MNASASASSVAVSWCARRTTATSPSTPTRTTPWRRCSGPRQPTGSPSAPAPGTRRSRYKPSHPENSARANGFSLHARVAAEPGARDKLERLARYITRPAVSEQRLSLTTNGLVRYELKAPYRDGTTHVFFEPVDFIARLAALIPKPRVNLIRSKTKPSVNAVPR